MKRYTNIALPEDLAKRIDVVIKSLELGYKTKGEFVKEAVRNSLKEVAKFEDLKKFEPKKKK